MFLLVFSVKELAKNIPWSLSGHAVLPKHTYQGNEGR